MSSNPDDTLPSKAEESKPINRSRTSVRTMLVLVACCAAILWACRHLSENYDAAVVEARSDQNRAIAALQSKTPAERVAAIQNLGRVRFGEISVSVPPLIGALGDPDSAVRGAAAQTLGAIESSEMTSSAGGEAGQAAVLALVRLLKSQDAADRIAAARALGPLNNNMIRSRFGNGPIRQPQPIAYIKKSILSSGFDNGTIRTTLKALIERLKDTDARVRAEAVTALGILDSPLLTFADTAPISPQTVMDELSRMVVDRDTTVRLAAIRALAPGFGPPGTAIPPPQALAEGLKDEAAQNRVAAISGLNRCNQGLDPWLPILFQLAEQDPDASVRNQSETTIGQAFKPPAITAAVVPYLRGRLASKDAEIRGLAVTVLGTLNADSRPAIPDLLRVLNEPPGPDGIPSQAPSQSDGLAHATILALGKIAPNSSRAKEVIAALTEVVRKGPPRRHASAAWALRKFDDAAEPAVPVLITLIKEAPPDDPFERKAASIEALGRIAPETASADQAIAALQPFILSKNYPCQVAAIEALSQFGPKAKSALPSLRPLMDKGYAAVREAATRAVQSIEGTP